MKLCRVTGNVVGTVKHPAYVGQKLMIVQPIDEKGGDLGKTFLAVDLVQAGPGDRVLVMQEGNGVRQIFGRDRKPPLPVAEAVKQALPIRSVIVGIVDAVDA